MNLILTKFSRLHNISSDKIILKIETPKSKDTSKSKGKGQN